MDIVNYDFDLEMIPGLALPQRLNVSKDDIGRTYTAALKWGGVDWTPGSATAKIQGTKPDGTVFDANATISGSSVSFTLAEVMAEVSGAVLCQIQFTSSGNKIGSANFIIEVERGAFDPAAPSESELSTFDELYTNAQAALANANTTLASIPTDYTTLSSKALQTKVLLEGGNSPDDVITIGLYYSTGWTGLPTEVSNKSGFLEVLPHSTNDNYIKQFFFPYNSYERWYRYRNAGTWTNWQLLPTRAEVDKLSDNNDNSAIKVFPNVVLPSNTNINTVLIGTWFCNTSSLKGTLTNIPSEVASIFRLDVTSFTRDGITDPDAEAPWITRLQKIVDYNGQIFVRYGTKGAAGTTMSWSNWLKFPTRAEVDALKSTTVGTITPASGSDSSGDLYAVKIGSWIHVRGYIRFSTAIPVNSETEIATISGIDFSHNVRFPCISGEQAYNAMTSGYCTIVASTKKILVRLPSSAKTVVFCTTFPADY